MRPGLLVYKCRRCNKEIKNIHVPDVDTVLTALIYEFDLPKEWFGVRPTLTDIHYCVDKNLGVSDLIGGEYD